LFRCGIATPRSQVKPDVLCRYDHLNPPNLTLRLQVAPRIYGFYDRRIAGPWPPLAPVDLATSREITVAVLDDSGGVLSSTGVVGGRAATLVGPVPLLQSPGPGESLGADTWAAAERSTVAELAPALMDAEATGLISNWFFASGGWTRPSPRSPRAAFRRGRPVQRASAAQSGARGLGWRCLAGLTLRA
jgi:hypothetical protein